MAQFLVVAPTAGNNPPTGTKTTANIFLTDSTPATATAAAQAAVANSTSGLTPRPGDNLYVFDLSTMTTHVVSLAVT